jgi:GcrA cell cycle regulator
MAGMSPSASGWNDESVARLKTMLRDGASASEIAEALGFVSRSGVIGKVHRLGLAFANGWGRHDSAQGRTARDAAPPPRKPTSLPRSAAQRPQRQDAVQRAAVAERPSPPADVAATAKGWPKAAGPNAVSLINRKTGQCCMPLWGLDQREGLYCGEPVEAEGKSYCAPCARLMSKTRRGPRIAAPSGRPLVAGSVRTGAFA